MHPYMSQYMCPFALVYSITPSLDRSQDRNAAQTHNHENIHDPPITAAPR